ncbi:cell surface protein [Myroides pelagicus]|uniref:Cell surface protein n=1 Tax=Myroides pelagicus TaxID=270914 RepID=A0A7K1GL40_9FLAO|nr:cell surface protein [Myroides pelagicus]MTH29536.1 cell surface protein [Myroides pelagicus]
MKNYKFRLSTFALLCFSTVAFYSCSSDDNSDTSDPIPTENPLNLAPNYTVDRSKLVFIKPDLKHFTNPNLQWKVIEQKNVVKDSLISQDTQLDFVALKDGKYTIAVEAKDNKTTVNQEFDIIVQKESQPYSSKITKVFEYRPSYGQYVNKLPKYEEGDTQETMNQKAEDNLVNDKMITLGGFGGYVIFGFDHTIVNVPGKRDFRVLGNAFPNSSEPGIVMLAYDKNQNGKPDDDEWYEIKGSEYANPKTIHNYEITFYKPSAKLDAINKGFDEYIKYKNNQGEEGYKAKNSYHNQSYYPLWINEESITFKGSKLPNNATDIGGNGNNWKLPAYEYGYVDNHPKYHDESAFDIAWAIDKQGNSVKLPGIDFIKVYNAMDQEAGWFGETSTEVVGAWDLHEKGINIETRK